MATTEDVSSEFLAEDRSQVLVDISIAFIVLTTVVLAARFYARRFQGLGGFHADDAFVLAAYVVNLGMCAVGIILTKVGGVGRHVIFLEQSDPSALVGWAKCLFAFEIVYFISVALPKLSIICLYLRIFSWKGAMRTTAWTLFGLTAATSIALTLTACFQCIPLAFFWDRTIAGGRCFDIQQFFHAQALPGFILDLIIMVLPMSTIWHLKLPTIKRFALLGIFAIASFGIVASIIRATIFFGTEAFADETWASVDLVGWSIIETSVYIITCCLPNLRPLVSHYTPAWLKRAVKSSVTRSTGLTGATSKGLSGIHKSTSFGHSLASKKGHVTDDAIELTGRGDSRAWVRVDSMEALDRASSQGSPGLPIQLSQQQSQSLGTTTHITTGNKSHFPLG